MKINNIKCRNCDQILTNKNKMEKFNLIALMKKYNRSIMALSIVGLSIICLTVFNYASSAYAEGQRSVYHECTNKIETAKAALNSIEKPPKSQKWYKDEWNSKGEMHPRIRMGKGLQEFVYNNCDEKTNEIFNEISEYAKGKGIRPEFIFAVSWADTQCGNALTTPNNYGNVNNNDRGNRVGYFSPLEGWKAIVDTLGNKYMGKNYLIGHVTNGGRSALNAQHNCSSSPMGWKCYATSEENHNKNMLRAIRVMFKDESINEKWKFRF